MRLDLLLEIGCEEIPHWMIPGALKQLSALNVFGATPHVDATPRRLVVRASGLPDRTPDQELVVKGPPLSAGDKAAAGFAKKQGVDPAAMTKAGDYYELRKTVPGSATLDLLAASLPGAILNMQWPKTMYWTGGKTGPRFIRPIRWIVALLGDQVIPFEIAGVKSGSVTRGHRILGKSAIPVSIANYEAKLRTNFVILSADERRAKIDSEITKLGAKPDADLLETLTYITEYPTAIKGDFDAAYLELPAEVLTTVMKHHQKYFSVESAPGKLANHFVAVMNTSGDPDGLVKKGNERVLRARFNDARFFWNVDQSKTLTERTESLTHVSFHAKLGSYKEKVGRIYELVRAMGGDEHALRAALLCKADLTTEMVKEFTDLQGVIGGLYAKAQDEPEPVWRAISEHYKPLSMEDSIPSSASGRMVALADRLDTLQEFFAIGLEPSGSKDPFGLRRAAQGVVKILVDPRPGPSLDKLAHEGLRQFVADRVRHYFKEVEGFKYDEVNAVMAVGWASLPDVQARLQALAAVRPTEDFEPLAASFKRIKNILQKANHVEGLPIVESDFEEDAEKQLYREWLRVVQVVKTTGDYRKVLEAIASTRPSVDRFFDDLLVMDKDRDVRERRLELLQRISKQFSTIADFSEIVTSGDQK